MKLRPVILNLEYHQVDFFEEMDKGIKSIIEQTFDTTERSLAESSLDDFIVLGKLEE
jgi:hypothetical protein